jgi:hypothetical protein
LSKQSSKFSLSLWLPIGLIWRWDGCQHQRYYTTRIMGKHVCLPCCLEKDWDLLYSAKCLLASFYNSFSL